VMFSVARVWDAINDPLWGRVIDLARVWPDGRYCHWLKVFCVPVAIAAVLMFVRLPSLSERGYLVYAYVTYILFGMVYTCLNIPYGSMAQVITEDSRERASLSVARSVGGCFGAIPALILISFCYTTNADGLKQMDYRKVLFGVIAISVLCVICYAIYYFNTKERIILPSVKKKKGSGSIYWYSIKTLLKDRAIMTSCFAAMFYLASQQFQMSYSTYLFQYYFGAPQFTMLPTIFSYLPVAVMMFFAVKLGDRFGKRRICAYGLLAAGLGNLILYFMHTHNVWLYIAVCLISGIGTTFIYLLIWGIAADAIDHATKHSGVEEAYSYSFFSFMRKLGHCVAAVCVNMVLFRIGYSDNVLNVGNITDKTLSSMYTYSVLVPALLFVITYVLLRFVYPKEEKEV
jgi:GPH family glycoside/pentoside/hexuronide:cation symporter